MDHVQEFLSIAKKKKGGSFFSTCKICSGTRVPNISDTCSSQFLRATQQVSFKRIKAIRVPYGKEGRQTSAYSPGTKSAYQKHLERVVQGLEHSKTVGSV